MPEQLCRSCSAPILWARTESSRWIPLDAAPAQPSSPGTLFVLRETDQEKPLALAIPPEAIADEPAYRAHFASCPNADAWRRPRERAEKALGIELGP